MIILDSAIEGSHDQTEWMGDPAVSDLLSDQGNFTNFSQVVDCPQFSESSQQLVAQFSFWIEGVTQVITAGEIAVIKQCWKMGHKSLTSLLQLGKNEAICALSNTVQQPQWRNAIFFASNCIIILAYRRLSWPSWASLETLWQALFCHAEKCETHSICSWSPSLVLTLPT